ncbi:MAG: ribosome biogenesis GTPase Der [Candidatus Peregrinibacteria bacterium]
MDPSPTVAIVGKPNVGKSTLFNRLIGKRHAVIAREAGTTRDRIYQKIDIGGYEISLVDTGGIEYGKKDDIESDVQAQAKVAIEEADIIVFVTDITQNLTVDDYTAANILRKSKKTVILIANKSDNEEMEKNIFNIYELGFGEPIAISAIHKLGMENLKRNIEETLEKLKFKKRKKQIEGDMTNICILGRPNAGKSSLVNALLSAEKVIVSSRPGTTRDAVDTEVTYKKKRYNLTDTAGLRKAGKRSRGIEKFSSLRCINAIERSDIVVLLIDGEEAVSNQDTHIAQLALESEKGIIIAINKIDIFKEQQEFRDIMASKLMKKFPFIPWAPVIFVSAKNKTNVKDIFNLADKIMEERNKRIKTAQLNSFLQKITQKHMPSSAKAIKPKFLYASQVDTSPPKFVLFFKNLKNLHFTYPRYMENELRKEYGFDGTAIYLKFKEKVGRSAPR